MTHRESWDGLRAPTRGARISRRPLPPVHSTSELARAELRTALSAGRLVTVRRGYVAAPPPADLTVAERTIHQVLTAARATVSSLRLPGAVSHVTAAMALGCWVVDPPRVVHLTQSRHVATPGSGAVAVQRHTATLPADDLRLHDDVLITSPTRTAIDCARTEPFLRALPIVDSLLALGVAQADLLARLAEMAHIPGVRRARRVCEAATGKVHSPGESLLRAHCELVGLPRPCPLHEVETDLGSFQLDLAWPDLKVGVEFDGAMKLAGLEGEALTRRVNANAAREAALVAKGWVVLHLTWSDLRDPVALRQRLVRLVRHRAI